jgi:hypothetical protein
MSDNHSSCCGGLEFPKLPHLHAEDCPTRQLDTFTPFREAPDERRMFDGSNKNMYGGKSLVHISCVLDTYGRAQSRDGMYGSYSQQSFIMANEVMAAQARMDALEADLAKSKAILAMLPEDQVERATDLWEQVNDPSYGE